MNLKQKMKTYSFWISLVSAILIVVRLVGDYFGWFINDSFIMDVVTGICGILVLLGILSSPTKKDETMDETTLKEQSEIAKTQQENLTQTIKTDVANSMLTIQEQIELLKNNAQAEVGCQTQQNELTSEHFGLEFVPESEVIAPAIKEESTAIEEISEEIILGSEENLCAQNCDSYSEFAMQTMEIEQAEEATQSTQVAVEEKTDNSFENKVEEVETTGVVEQPTALETQEITKEVAFESVEDTENNTVETDFSKLSTDELKALLFEVLQRL